MPPNQLDQSFVNHSLSHGTMRNEDLIPSFMEFLKEHDPHEVEFVCKFFALQGWPHDDGVLVMSDPFDMVQEELAHELIAHLWEALDNIAPEGCCFCAHSGDGSDYGFWEMDDDPFFIDR